MATIQPTVVNKDDIKTVKWDNLNTSDLDGLGVGFPEYADRSVHITGTWDTSTLQIQGSNDLGVTWFLLQEPDGTDLSFTAGTPLKQIGELALLMRPLMSSAGASSDLDIFMVMRKSTPMRQ